MICENCPHPMRVHSVYRDKCLVRGCSCTVCGGSTITFEMLKGM